MAGLTTDAIVLQVFAYGETSRILRLLTRDCGLHSVIAKGAARPRSRFGPILEPFVQGTATIFLKQGRELQTLAGFELQRTRLPLAADLLRFGAASLATELLVRTASEEAHPELFDALSNGLDRLASAPDGERHPAALATIWHIVAMLGFAPSLDTCIGCGRTPADRAAVVFDYSGGGVRCASCAVGHPGVPLPCHAQLAVETFCAGNTVALAVSAGHWRLLRRYLEHHVTEGSRLRSLEFLDSALAQG